MNFVVFLFPAVVFYLFLRHWAKPSENEPERRYISESEEALPEVTQLLRHGALEPGSIRRDCFIIGRGHGRQKGKLLPQCCVCNEGVDGYFIISPILHIGQRNVHLPCKQTLLRSFLAERYALFASLDALPRDIVVYAFALALRLCITPVLYYTVRYAKNQSNKTLRRALQTTGVLFHTERTFHEVWFMIYCNTEQYIQLRALEFDLVPYGK